MAIVVVELEAFGRPAVRTKPAAGFVVAVWLVIGRDRMNQSPLATPRQPTPLYVAMASLFIG